MPATILRRGRIVALAALGLAGAAPSARAGCNWADVVKADEARASTVRAGAPRIDFVEDDPNKGCPGPSPACRGRAYLTDGDAVLTSRSAGGFTCAGFTSAKGVLTTGWLPTGALAALPETAVAPADLVGHWIGQDADLTIAPGAGDALAVKGEASWGRSDARRGGEGPFHIGAVAGTARPENGVLAFTMGEDKTLPYAAGDPDDCRIRLWRRGPYLVVRDNNACGGANVSFTGLYARRSAAPPPR